MVVRRVASACAMMLVSACSVVACALLVGPPDDRLLIPTDEASSSVQAVSIDVSATDASPSADDSGDAADASVPDVAKPFDESSLDAPVNPCAIGPTDLITNGDFSEGGTGWVVYTGPGTIVLDGGTNELCVEAPAAQYIGLAWTPGTSLDTGPALYTFSFCARASVAGLMINETVGHSVSPNMPIDFSGMDLATTSWPDAAFSHLVAGGNDNSAGLSFTFQSTVDQLVCFRGVSLTPAIGDN